MHVRIAKLESDVGHIQADTRHIREDVREIRQDLKEIRNDAKIDFRLLFGALIVAVIGLAGLMARGFGWWS